MTKPAEQGAELSDVELLRRAVAYSRPHGFDIVEKWREVASQFGLSETLARTLCERFGVDPRNTLRDSGRRLDPLYTCAGGADQLRPHWRRRIM